jgi:type IV fimbrial biogenesis protein FimT
MNQRGASLVELLSVVAILALAGTLCGPSWSALAGRQKSWAVTRAIAGELRLARQLAMSRHTRVRVLIDGDQAAVRTHVDGGATLLRSYEFEDKRTTVESMSNGADITFYPSGRSATANTIVLRDRQYNKRVITVGITGKVTVS